MNLALAASLSEQLPTYQLHTGVISFVTLKVTALRERHKSMPMRRRLKVNGVSKQQVHGFAPRWIPSRISSSFDVAKYLPHVMSAYGVTRV